MVSPGGYAKYRRNPGTNFAIFTKFYYNMNIINKV